MDDSVDDVEFKAPLLEGLVVDVAFSHMNVIGQIFCDELTLINDTYKLF